MELKPNLLIWSTDVTKPVFGKQRNRLIESPILIVSSIYVDAVINHMAAGGNQASAGSSYNPGSEDFPGVAYSRLGRRGFVRMHGNCIIFFSAQISVIRSAKAPVETLTITAMLIK